MSNRTIVEFNHDYWDAIDADPDAFVLAVLSMLQNGVNDETDTRRLRHFGVRPTVTAHHSETRRVVIGKYYDEEF